VADLAGLTEGEVIAIDGICGCRLQSARFPIHRDLAGFDFEAAKVDGTLIGELTGTQFTDAAHNVVLIGGTGTGKNHLATGLGRQGYYRQRQAGALLFDN